ncbi:MAG: hypothetical protein Q8Q50_06015 [Methylobacter sp.]|nr:hypothetical protein [Methylobacter sp.]
MALNLEVLEVLEDIDPTSRQPRIRARVRELKPRMHLVNLKNCDAEQISTIKNNVGAVLSLPGREMMMDGRFILSIPQTEEEFFIVRPAVPVAVSKTVEISSSDANAKGDNPQLRKVG